MQNEDILQKASNISSWSMTGLFTFKWTYPSLQCQIFFLPSPFTFGYSPVAFQTYLQYYQICSQICGGSMPSYLKAWTLDLGLQTQSPTIVITVTLGQLLSIFVPWFLNVQGGDINKTYLIGMLWGQNELALVKFLEHCPGDSKSHVLIK